MVKEKKIHIHITRELVLGLVLLLVVACVALGLTAREYADAFLPRTTVNGVRVTAMDTEAAANALVKAAAKEELIFLDHTTGEILYTADMGKVVDRQGVEAQLKTLLAEQKTGKNAVSFLLRGA